MNSKIPNLESIRFEAFLNATGVGIWDWQVQTGDLQFNKIWADMLGHTLGELQPIKFSTWSNTIHPDDFIRANILLDQHFNNQIPFYEFEARMKHKSGHYIWVLALGKLVERDDAGNPKRMVGSHQDITQRKDIEMQMLLSSELLNESQRMGKLGGWTLNLITNVLFWSDETYRIHETSAEEFNPSVDSAIDLYLPDSRKLISEAFERAIINGIGYDLELQIFTFKGQEIDVRTTCTIIREGGKIIRLTGIFQDITERKTNQRRLEKSNRELESANSLLVLFAYYDVLTGLPNRKLLAERIQQALDKSHSNNTYVSIAFIDLDGFKKVNDNYGHNIGDELLITVGTLLKNVLRADDTLARIGGDEFVAVIGNISSPLESDVVVARMLKAVSSTIIIQKKLLKISASIGVTHYPLDDSDPDKLIRHADQAMYIAKQKGKNCRHIFDIENDAAVILKNEEVQRIEEALTNEEFLLYYQPKVNLSTLEVVGLEALIRWNHPEKGIVSPNLFLPVIQNHILEIEIGKWVIKNALIQHQCWLSLGLNILISINISALHLQHYNFVSDLKMMILEYGDIKQVGIEFEILETSALKDIKLISKVIKACNKLGVSFSIDDFGTGYSSLSYLQRLPVETLKIDQSFVINMLTNPNDKAIIQGIIGLAQAFGLKVIVEGVETPEHAELLLSMGSYIAQGYSISKPMPAKNILSWMDNWKNKPCLVDGRL
ncbi:bifunctional diguanylate cyclase/phosphodiesterase [Shewanella glacialimarina]|uniref:bifunctional diguanylate cyclase/phosphodiesterase n=1 Tax=Shewanella glacialimarina TaxID=2590884 RepID=UPI001CF87ABC|nr:GGDEF domain-containing phosphodiesterase [Shewanella glacialimarina]